MAPRKEKKKGGGGEGQRQNTKETRRKYKDFQKLEMQQKNKIK